MKQKADDIYYLLLTRKGQYVVVERYREAILNSAGLD